jgi:PAS domain S-box-containing protein
MTADNVAASIEFEDKETAKEVLSILQEKADFKFVLLKNANGELFTSISAGAAPFSELNNRSLNPNEDSLITTSRIEDNIIITTVPIKSEGSVKGRLILGLSLDKVQADITTNKIVAFAVSVFLVSMLVLASIFIGNHLTKPIQKVIGLSSSIAEGDFSKKLTVDSQDEIGKLTNAINDMSNKLNESIGEREQSEEKYQKLIEFADVGIISAEKNVITQVNKKAAEIYGYSKKELLGQPPSILTTDEHSKNHQKMFEEIRLFGKAKKTVFEETGVRKDGSLFPLEISYSLSDLENEENCNIIAIMRDITERITYQETLETAYDEMERRVQERTMELKKSNEQLQKEIKERNLIEKELLTAKESAESANKAKSDFLANMSHELRTPLNHIIGFTELVLDKNFGDLNDTQREYLGDVLQSSQHLLSLINDILDLSKVEAGKQELEPTNVDLKELLERSLIMFKEKTLKHGLQLSLNVEHVPDTITADERKLKQIVYNLVANAVKFTPEGGSVTLAACHISSENGHWKKSDGKLFHVPVLDDDQPSINQKNCVVISVKDTGIGIAQEDLKRIFNPFEQVDTSSSRKYQGTGLGLSLCRKLVKLHGGILWAESEGKGKGTTLIFIIPA